MAFFWWVLGVFAIFGFALLAEYVWNFLADWPFEE